MSEIEPFHLAIPDEVLADLARRLDMTRWPEKETVDDWSQGTPLSQLRSLCDHWRDGYDWRRCEAMLNGLGQHRTEIDGLGIHFLHIRSREADALPLLITHGWPGSVVEFHKVIAPLVDPVAHGGQAQDAFHLILPSLPGFGFSDKPRTSGWGVERIAAAWLTLVRRLGYANFVAQGGDWGAAVTTQLATLAPPELRAIHLNMPAAAPDPATASEWTDEERERAEENERFRLQGVGYSVVQRTRPQTIGYGLVDSPTAQAAWIYEKLFAWSDCDGDPRSLFGVDEILDAIMMYWLPGTGASSARLYWESLPGAFQPRPIDTPTGISIFPKELFRPSRRQAERTYRNIMYWNEVGRGGHFAAFEQPRLFVEEMRACFRGFHR